MISTMFGVKLADRVSSAEVLERVGIEVDVEEDFL